jgi:hypothetical protein
MDAEEKWENPPKFFGIEVTKLSPPQWDQVYGMV